MCACVINEFHPCRLCLWWSMFAMFGAQVKHWKAPHLHWFIFRILLIYLDTGQSSVNVMSQLENLSSNLVCSKQKSQWIPLQSHEIPRIPPSHRAIGNTFTLLIRTQGGSCSGRWVMVRPVVYPGASPRSLEGTDFSSHWYPPVSSNMACWKMDHRKIGDFPS